MEASELAFAGIARQAELIRSREVSSRELVELYLERIERLDPTLNAFRVVLSERALADADAADDRVAAGDSGDRAPLLGVPIALKDTEPLAGEIAANGSAAFDRPAPADGEMVRRLRSAGAVVIGKTNLPELAICGFTESERWGVTRNPWDPDRTPSGSSGGSGAAVAAGLCAAASGSDGMGSIRNPAAFCGLVGLKPQHGRVPLAPDRDHWYGLTDKGSLTRTVLDTALFLDVAMGRDAAGGAPPPPSRPYVEAARTAPGRLRVAISTRPARLLVPPVVTDEVTGAVAETGQLLRSIGHVVERSDPRYGLAGTNAAGRYLRGIHDDAAGAPRPELLERRTKGFARLGGLHPRGAVELLRRAAARDARRINAIFDRFDVLITPVIGEPPFEVERWLGRGAVRTLLGMSRRFCFAPIWNHTGQPAMAIPAGLSADGLPLSVQLVGRPGDEETLISLAAQLEAERGWGDLRPGVS